MVTTVVDGRARPMGSGAIGDPLVELVTRASTGDEAALRALYEATSAHVFGICLQILRDRASAEEALVEVFAQVWRQCARFDASRGSVSTWIATLARTRAIDVMRARTRDAERHGSLDLGQLDVVKDPGASPEEASHASERAAR